MKNSEFSAEFRRILLARCGREPAEAQPYELHEALAGCLMERLARPWRETEQSYDRRKRVFYFSAEFLVGRAVYNNLLALGLTGDAEKMFHENGTDLNRLEEIEDAALGNGGLGRLAACYLDSAATAGIPLQGCGIRYRFGLFRQKLEDGFQKETCDDWMRYGDPWSVRKESEAVTVAFGDQTVRAVPYDMPIIGYGGKNINTLCLWQSEPLEEFDFTAFNDQHYEEAVREKNRAEDISRVLYPNDSGEEGKILRIKQQYFFCSASVQDLLRRLMPKCGGDPERLPEFCAVQLNDTHPTVAICEFVRILCGEYRVGFEKAFSLAQQVFHYTNHTVMAEALETWELALFRRVLLEIAEIVEKIDAQQARTFPTLGGNFAAVLEPCRVVRGGRVRMANLAVYGSATVNGVAKIHTGILEKEVLKDWYRIYPERFRNVTNGITQRRWLALCNPELSALITELLGGAEWITDLSRLRELNRYAGDGAALDAFAAVKNEKKRQLSAYIGKREEVFLPGSFLFDVQAKRLHEYKRQFLNALSILDLYFDGKDGKLNGFTPTAFVFGAKAAPGYLRAKGIIKLVSETARLVNGDSKVKDLLRVVFVQNYDVSYAEKLVCAANLSEQISTAGTEASGTGNMKFMLNGTPTLGTYDGANIEIVEEAGMENNYIFGARVEELDRIRDSYDPNEIYRKDARVHRALDALVDGTLSDGGTGMFRELYDSILKGASWHRPDPYFLLYDFEPYRETRLRANRDYQDPKLFARKEFRNMANAGKFSSDRSIEEYAKEIWNLK